MGLRLGAPCGGGLGYSPCGKSGWPPLTGRPCPPLPVWGSGMPEHAGAFLGVGRAGCEWLLCPHSRLPQSQQRAIEVRMQSEVLTLLSNLADLANAVHWLPPGVLWAGCFPPWLVGLMGTISSLLSIYQAAQASGQPEAASS